MENWQYNIIKTIYDCYVNEYVSYYWIISDALTCKQNFKVEVGRSGEDLLYLLKFTFIYF